MKVRELIEQLQACNPEAKVIIPGDGDYVLAQVCGDSNARKNGVADGYDLSWDEKPDTIPVVFLQ